MRVCRIPPGLVCIRPSLKTRASMSRISSTPDNRPLGKLQIEADNPRRR
jgi:hypothetical protein